MALLDTLKKFAYWLAFVYLLVILISFSFMLTPYGRDDSDEQGWGSRRSGMIPRVDYLTGCQYLANPDGGIVIRYDGNGNQVGCKHD